MYVKAKNMAFAGVLAAFSVLLIVLSAVIESNSLFLLAAASFCVGIAIREWGVRLGTAFLAACAILGLIVAPNKIYCLTFIAMGSYILLREILWLKTTDAERYSSRKRKTALWIGKYIVFNCIYIPAIVFFPSLIVEKKLTGGLLCLIVLGGQIGLFIYDKAYEYFQACIWKKFRNKLIK